MEPMAGGQLPAFISPQERYRTWIDAIFDHCFPEGKSGRLVTFAFDDDTLLHVAATIDIDHRDFLYLIKYFARPDLEDAFIFWREHAIDDLVATPVYVGILAALSLAASRMTRANGHPSFHRELNRLIASPRGSLPTNDFVRVSNLWFRLAEYLENECGGRRGRLVVDGRDVFRGGHYVARALVQILVTEADRESLEKFFDRWIGHGPKIARDSVLAIVEADIRLRDASNSPISVELRRKYVKCLDNSDDDNSSVLDRLRAIVYDAYETWFLTTDQRSAKHTNPDLSERTPRSAGERLVLRLDAGPPRAVPRNVIRVAPSPQRSSRRDAEDTPATRRRDTVHFHLVIETGHKPAELIALVKRFDGSDAQCKISAVNNGASFLEISTNDGEQISYDLDSGLLFVEDSLRIWVRRMFLPPSVACAIVAPKAHIDELRLHLRLVAGDIAVRSLREPLEAYSVVTFVSSDRADIEAKEDDHLSSIFASPYTALPCRDGLKIGNSYLSAAPPTIILEHPGFNESPVYVDDEEIGVAKRDIPFRLPRGLSSGIHRVRVAGASTTIRVDDIAVASRTHVEPKTNDTKRADLGYEISRPMGLWRCVRDPGDFTIEARNPPVVRLVTGGTIT